LSHRGPGRRKKNPDIPPELLNNPFKHFKVDNHTDRSVNLSNGEAIKTDDTNKSTSHDSSPSDGVTISFEGPRDANNNASSTAHKDLQFKTPVSRVANMTSPQAAMNHTPPHLHVSPRFTTTHVIHSPTNTSSSRIVSPPSGVILAPNSQSCAFNFPPRPHVTLSPQGNVLSPQTNGVPPTSGASTVATHSPGRSPAVGDAVNGEASVPHVSSTGTSEHAAEFRAAAANDTGSDISASSPHVLSREPEYREPGSTESLLFNIQGLLKVAAENTRQHERQAVYEKSKKLKDRQLHFREEKVQLNFKYILFFFVSCLLPRFGVCRNFIYLLAALLQKKLKKEKRTKRKLAERLMEEQHRCELLEEQLKESTQNALKQRNDELIQEVERERTAKIEAERKLKGKLYTRKR
ncbi:unnamed protein product, partial [Porites evermanni]